MFPKRAKRIAQAKADAEEAERLRLRKEAGEDEEENKVEPVWVTGAVAAGNTVSSVSSGGMGGQELICSLGVCSSIR